MFMCLKLQTRGYCCLSIYTFTHGRNPKEVRGSRNRGSVIYPGGFLLGNS